MEDNNQFIFIKKFIREKKKKKNIKSNYLLTIRKQKLVISILIIIIILLCLITAILLFLKNSIGSGGKNINSLLNLFSKNENNYFKLKKRLFQTRLDPIPEGKNQIHISMAVDNKFVFPCLISMTSALYNNNQKKNIIIYHLIFSSDFNPDNYQIFESLKKKFDFSLNYYIMPISFKNYRKWHGGTETIYYKIYLPLIFHDLDRIIYLDGDTMVFKDLYEMYNLPFNGNYALGYPFQSTYVLDKFNKNVIYYINAGVILFNIEIIRKDNKDIELIKYTKDNNNKLAFLEQDAINLVFYQKIGILPLKYGIYMYGNIDNFDKKVQPEVRFKLNRDEVINAINDPAIIHFSCCSPKIWHKGSKNVFGSHEYCQRFHNEFYNYAKKTDYYDKIYNTYIK